MVLAEMKCHQFIFAHHVCKLIVRIQMIDQYTCMKYSCQAVGYGPPVDSCSDTDYTISYS